MDQTGYILLSRMSALARGTEVLANNIANAETPGFRAARPIFTVQVEEQRDVTTPPGGKPVAYALDRATWRDTAAGSLTNTGNSLDLALQGEGYFVVETPRGERFTRAGHFTIGQDGRLQDMEGNAVLDARGTPLSFAPTDTRIEVAGDGTIRSENGPIGKLRVVRFANQQTLKAEGDRLFASDDPPEDIPRPGVVQGALEGSNVRPVLEMTRLTGDMRGFQMVAQFMDQEGKRGSDAVGRILGHAA
jgi:flagellar basal-body rod protein FlgF